MAQVLVQNRVSLAVPSLPDVIKQTGVTVRRRSPDPLLGFAITSNDPRHDGLYLSNYAARFVRDELARVPGITDIFLLGQMDYSVRVWVMPSALAARGLSTSDLIRAIREQNTALPLGSIGQQPSPDGQQVQITLDAVGRLWTVEQFEDILLRVEPDGR